MTARILAFAGATILGAALLAAKDTPTAKAREGIRAADLALAQAVADRSVERFKAIVAEDAVFYGNTISHGRDEVAANWAPLITDPKQALTWHPTEIDVAASGDLGYSSGPYELTVPGEDAKPVKLVGTYVSIWKRQKDGAWRIVRDIGTPPAPPPVKTP